MEPKIRFKGFEGEWKKVKANFIFKTFNEKKRPDLPVLSATQDRGMVTRDSIGYKIDHDKTNEATYKHILPGQFVIHLRSFQGGFAHSEIEGIASPAYTIMEFKNKELHHDYYWRYVFMSKKFIKSLEYITYGIRDGRSISYDDFKETSFIVPSKREQIKIAKYNKELDSQISASTSRLATLKQMKAASLQAMFPQEGEIVPKIRFKGFEGEWKKVKADSIFKTFNEKNRPDLPVLSATQDRGMVTRESIGYNIFHDTSNEATYKHILPGQFVIHLRSFQGGFAHSEIEGIASPAYTIMDFKNKDLYHDYYWRYVFMSKEFIKRLELITYGIRDGRSISYDEFKEMSFLVPSKEEQIKIASYLKNLDRQISLQSQRLEKLKQIKSACLDKMFV